MTRLLRFGPVLSACLALGACAQLIGLDKFDDKGGAEGGTSGSGGKGGSAGLTQGGSGGRGGTGTGGSNAGKGGGGGSAGVSGGSGEAGASASGGKGGTSSNPAGAAGTEEGGASGTGAVSATGGTGGGTENGGAGAGGVGNVGGCGSTIEITTFGYPAPDDETMPASGSGLAPYYDYTYYFNPELGTPDTDFLWIDFYIGAHYSGQETGHFVLGTGEEANYATCSRCVYIGQDEDSVSGDFQTFYYAKSGTMDIATDSKQTTGKPNFTLTNVLFTEVTIDKSNNSVSTEVPGGRCLHLATAAVNLTIPSGWNCSNAAYGTNDGCDCGCGAHDPDCGSTEADKLVGVCEYCGDNGSCSDSDCTDVTLDDNATCTPNQGWTCYPTSYGDGQTCDCGCGVKDDDCLTSDASECGYCGDPNACTLGSDCSTIDPVDNSKCD